MIYKFLLFMLMDCMHSCIFCVCFFVFVLLLLFLLFNYILEINNNMNLIYVLWWHLR